MSSTNHTWYSHHKITLIIHLKFWAQKYIKVHPQYCAFEGRALSLHVWCQAKYLYVVSVKCNQMKKEEFKPYSVDTECITYHLSCSVCIDISYQFLFEIQWHLTRAQDPGILQELAYTSTDSRKPYAKGILSGKKSFFKFIYFLKTFRQIPIESSYHTMLWESL